MQSKLNPYISFNNNTRQAMEFYKHVFGGNLTLTTFRESHAGDSDFIMHAMLEADNGITFMASDPPPGMEPDTAPAPDCPSTSTLANSSCAFCILACICWACFIKPASPPFIMLHAPSLDSNGSNAGFVNTGIEQFDRFAYEGVLLNRLDGTLMALPLYAARSLGGRLARGSGNIDNHPD